MTTETQIDAAEAEAQLIGLCLQGNVLPEELPRVPPDYWSQPINAAAWAAIVGMHGEGIRVPTGQAVMARLPETVRQDNARHDLTKYLDGCAGLAPIVAKAALTLALDEHAVAIRRLGSKRALRLVSEELTRLADDPAMSAEEALAQMERELSRLRVGEVIAPVTLRELVNRLADDITRPAQVMPTGLSRLDSSLAGGIWSGKLYGIAARMKVGKTVTLATIGRNAARAGHRVLYVALEMGQSEVAQRVIADQLGCNSVQFLRRDDPMLPERLVGYALRRDAAELDNLLFKDWPGCTLEQLKTLCHAAVAHHRVEMIVLDYWQLVQGTPKGHTETQHLAAVAQWLADFARRAGVAVITAAQINRDGQTRGSDGLRLACDWYAHLHPAGPDKDRDRWVEVLDSRYTVRIDLGSEDRGELFVDNIGPVLREWR